MLRIELPLGLFIVVTGVSGSGKSSLINLIPRFYDPQFGRILVDGIDVRGWNLASLRQQISIIEQDIFLFSRTIAENIAFGHPEATPEQIEAAAKAAQAHVACPVRHLPRIRIPAPVEVNACEVAVVSELEPDAGCATGGRGQGGRVEEGR